MKKGSAIGFPVAFAVLISAVDLSCADEQQQNISSADTVVWVGAPASQIPVYTQKDGELIWYGRELIANTAKYLGPKGSVLQITNGMNCQNCHLDAGTRPWGNNYGAVYSTYPKFRDRSGTIETIYKRINDCIERSLNGSALDTLSKEILAMYTYIKWLGKEVPKNEKPKGTGIEELPFPDRVADVVKGKAVYIEKCQRCHGKTGEGQVNIEGWGYTYPPLWGENSYNTGAGIYRLSKFAGYVKKNMPLEAEYKAPEITNEEAWDVAAYVNSQPRPVKDLSKDWPDISKKPFDYPFGPFADTFSERQHKYGPFHPIQQFKNQQPEVKELFKK